MLMRRQEVATKWQAWTEREAKPEDRHVYVFMQSLKYSDLYDVMGDVLSKYFVSRFYW